MKKIYIDRLKKIPEHLKHGKMGHKQFWIAAYHLAFNEINKNKPENKSFCGSLGCIVGEFPIIYPRTFYFTDNKGDNKILLKRHSTDDTSNDVNKYLGLNITEYRHLFLPRNQTLKYGGKILGGTATKIQVANNVLAFIKYKESK